MLFFTFFFFSYRTYKKWQEFGIKSEPTIFIKELHRLQYLTLQTCQIFKMVAFLWKVLFLIFAFFKKQEIHQSFRIKCQKWANYFIKSDGSCEIFDVARSKNGYISLKNALSQFFFCEQTWNFLLFPNHVSELKKEQY